NVAPFKAQNMSNNAGVTPEGGEMGRAQIVQAEAAGIAPHTDMNPVLLKPEAQRRSQIVLNGNVYGHITAQNWLDVKRLLWDEVRAAYDRLAQRHDVIILEGAGSPAEINLKRGDIVNLNMARHAQAPCLLIGDIDRGGVFAALAGTLFLLELEERGQIQGLLINKFRGDPTLLGDVNSWFQDKAFGVPTLGVIPHIPDLQISDEDAVVLDERAASVDAERGQAIEIVVIHLPHIANFDEFAPLSAEDGVHLRYVRDAAAVGRPHAIIVPGTKVTIADLIWLQERGLAQAIAVAEQAGSAVVGICGGYQMLGERLVDPLGIEGPLGSSVAGLGLLPVATTFQPQKATNQSTFRWQNLDAPWALLRGYEIHSGVTTLGEGSTALGTIIARNGRAVQVADGALSVNGRVWGCYLHGIFENDAFRRHWLHELGWRGVSQSAATRRQRDYDQLADVVETAVDWRHIERLLGL
ncbi:MAG: cobyric acid synthase, partial [Caldilineaceae bacterium]|nr:cobyric acid synthase [Caldilineaceae bacterium]